MPDTRVKVFRSSDSGAPALSASAGTLIAVLDACLQDGYGIVTIDSLVVASNVATVTDSTGHGFTAIGTVGPVVRMAGATPAGLNGDWRMTVVSTTVFTFATTGISDQTATGTITAKRAPAGFTKAFSGTNLAAYRSDDVTGTRLYLRIDDTGTTNAIIIGYESMSDVNTGTGAFATNKYVYKADSGAVDWTVIADSRLCYVFCNSGYGNWNGGFIFGDIHSYVPGDAYSCVICGGATSGTNPQLYAINAASNAYLARSYTQLGSYVQTSRFTHSKSSTIGNAGQSYPSPAGFGVQLWPVECWEGTSLARGMYPGLWNPLHSVGYPTQGTVIDAIAGLNNGSVLSQTLFRTGGVSTMACFDISGPWR